jgi:methylglutaconyl-CoA hydratase
MGQSGFEENYQDALLLAYMFDSIARCPKPTIARVNGATIGGGSGLAAACDIAIGDEKAFFQFQ